MKVQRPIQQMILGLLLISKLCIETRLTNREMLPVIPAAYSMKKITGPIVLEEKSTPPIECCTEEFRGGNLRKSEIRFKDPKKGRFTRLKHNKSQHFV